MVCSKLVLEVAVALEVMGEIHSLPSWALSLELMDVIYPTPPVGVVLATRTLAKGIQLVLI